jgi:hypothetical protein
MEKKENLPAIKSEENQLVMPIATIDQLKHAQAAVAAIVQGLQVDVDYGVIPGTKTSTLKKPGAERLCAAFGAHPTYTIVSQEVDHDRKVNWQKYGKKGESLGLYRYVIKCDINNAKGRFLASGIGSCSTMESKYIDRPRDLENTIIKMAQKRAFVGAVLNAFSLSDRFTQDVEDFQQEKPVPQAKPKAEEKGYDPSDPTHQKWLISQLDDLGISSSDHDEIAKLMAGKPSKMINDVVALWRDIKI